MTVYSRVYLQGSADSGQGDITVDQVVHTDVSGGHQQRRLVVLGPAVDAQATVTINGRHPWWVAGADEVHRTNANA